MRGILIAATCLNMLALAPSAPAQATKPAKGKAPVMLAEELVKECEADAAKAEKKYAGKTLRVSGTIASAYDDMLYLKGAKAKGGGTTDVGIRYAKGTKPEVKAGEEATFVGKFDRIAVLGPALVDCKLVKGEDAGDKAPK